MALSTEAILTAASDMLARSSPPAAGRHLDVGAGEGRLIELLRSRWPSLQSQAVDYTQALMKTPAVQVTVVNLNEQSLPFADASFDVVTMTEVIEHLENPRKTLRELFRVLQPGGRLVLTTPNILNLKSRLRFLTFGFYNLFGPLHVKETALHESGGHITPLSYFYLAHALMDAGFEEVTDAIDKRQSTSLAWYLLLGPVIALLSRVALRQEKRKYRTIDQHNLPFVCRSNSRDLLLGRTIIIGCRKPGRPT